MLLTKVQQVICMMDRCEFILVHSVCPSASIKQGMIMESDK